MNNTPWENGVKEFDLIALHTRWDQAEAERILG